MPAPPCDDACLTASRSLVATQAAFGRKIFGGVFPASDAFDGNRFSQAATGFGTNQWLAARLAPNTPVGYVLLHYNNPTFVGNIEIFVADSCPTGGTTTVDGGPCVNRIVCGGGNSAGASQMIFWCGGASQSLISGGGGRWIGVQRIDAAASYLVISELEIYAPGANGF